MLDRPGGAVERLAKLQGLPVDIDRLKSTAAANVAVFVRRSCFEPEQTSNGHDDETNAVAVVRPIDARSASP